MLKFKQWLENQILGGGMGPSIQSPFDPEPAAGQTDAFSRHYPAGSEELPPIKKRNKKVKKGNNF